MQGRLILFIGATLILASVAVSACGGAAPAPTAAPAAPTTAAAVAPTTAAVPPADPTSAAPAATPAPPASASSPSGAGDVTAGKAVFDQNCNACHPGGDRGAGPALRGKNLAAARITRQVRNGGGSMPAFSTSQISDQQLNNLIAYVDSLK